MYDNMAVVVPSSGRAKNVRCLAELPPEVLRRTLVCVPEDQEGEYLAHNRANIHPVPNYVQGIAATRQHMTEVLREMGIRFMLQISDDVRFFRRKSAEDVHLRPVDEADMLEMVDTLLEFTAETGHAGISARGGNNRQPDPVRLATRMCDVYMHDLVVLEHYGIRWDRNVVMEDFDVTLSLLRRGHPNAVLYEWAWDQPASNAAGGCSDYRTFEVQKQGALRLHQLHPDFVKVVEKPSNNWKGFTTRFDVTVQWQKALKAQDLVGLPEVTV